MKKLVKLVRLNGLQYNANRDPQVYRRVAGEPFRVQALIQDGAPAHCALLDVARKTLASADIPGGDTFTHDLRFETAGVRIVTLTATRGTETFAQDLRLDVLEHAWVG